MPPAVLNPLTYDEHRDLGREIHNSRTRLLHLSVVVLEAYGQQSMPAFTFRKVNEAIDRLCQEMQAQAEIDCPGLNASAFYK